ncbi:hypothetical protein KWG64_04105 [Rahnella sp. PD12R]|uniref:hypothetical protein n=1 Tax=Rahnella sp. PD12R TaxID=2855688 RepID=UPI001C47CE3D|nr:hypothetical protein [Rahnella sp. PD12R]MBV6817122.1 hypothetical protein [Rahnella sp. PD12R]
MIAEAAAMAAFYFKFKFKFKTLGSPPKLAQRARKRAPSGHPRFFNCALSLAGCVSATPAIAAKTCRCAVPSFRSSSLRSRNTHSASFLNAATGFLVRNLAMPFIILKNEEASEAILLNGEMARSEILLTEGSRPQGSKPVGKGPRSGKISRHTLMFQNMSIGPAIARSKKSVGDQRGRRFPPSLAVSA